MGTKSWRPSWNTPGQSESSSAILDLIVNRNLTVKGKIIQPIVTPSWTPYTPTVHGYQIPAGPGGASSTMTNCIATGRWMQVNSIVAFQAVIQFTTPRSPNWNSNLYVDLPTKTNIQFSPHAVWHNTVDLPTASNDSGWYPLFGVARAGGNQLVIIPDGNAPGSVLLMSSTAFTLPFEVTVSGSYELLPSP